MLMHKATVIILFLIILGGVAYAQQKPTGKQCTENAWRCNADKAIPQQCTNGKWADKNICKYGCENNKCKALTKFLGLLPSMIKNKVAQKLSPKNSLMKISQDLPCQGCIYGGRCFAIGNKRDAKYCGSDKKWHTLKQAGLCNEYFECKSGICKKNQCAQEISGLRRSENPPVELISPREGSSISREIVIESYGESIIEPNIGIQGTMFALKVLITNTYPQIFPYATIREQGGDENILPFIIPLYDDGLHDDGLAGDDKFGGVWDSALAPLGAYEVSINARDDRGNIEKSIFNGQHVSISLVEEYPCNEIIPEHNNLDENRANVVFVFVNYNQSGNRNLSLQEFSEHITNGMDASLLTLEPFASNPDAFNFLYVDSIATVDEYAAGRQERGIEALEPANSLAASCVVPNKYIANYADWSFRPNSFVGGGSMRIPVSENMISTVKITAHEFGHLFGSLKDEYDEGLLAEIEQENSQCYYSPDVACADEHDEGRDDWAFRCHATTESIGSCEANARWKDMLGNGCGEDGMIDCATDDPLHHLEESCENIGCSRAINLHRHDFNNIMRNHWINPYSYGPVNQRTICNKIMGITGNAVGICETLCMEGCDGGQRCIQGVCTNV